MTFLSIDIEFVLLSVTISFQMHKLKKIYCLVGALIFTAILGSIDSYSQTCPTYQKRNNGNGGGNCASADAGNYGIYNQKTGHFTFTSGTWNFTVEKVYNNSVLIQDGTTLTNGSSVFFGNINIYTQGQTSQSDMCFYATSASGGVAPAGNFLFVIKNGSTTLNCSYAISSVNNAGLSTTTAGTIDANQTICSGGTPATLTSVTDATSFTSYKWQRSTTSTTSGFSDIPGATSSTYSPGVLTQTTYFQRLAVSADGEFASNLVTITIPTITSPSLGQTWSGNTITFQSNVVGGSWTISTTPNTGVATIDGSTGVLTASGAGSGTVTYTTSSPTCTITRNFTISGTTGSLPVTWETVSAEKQNGQSILRWSTASEQNTKDFVVQHSLNTTDWSSLTTVPAAGNSTTTRNYSYVHQNPLKGNNYNYYRILQRDIDDKFSYSKIVSIIFNEPGADLQVYPNPVQDQLTIFLAESQLVRLVNAAGATVWKGQLPAGRNTIPVHTYSKGVYVLTAGMQSQRVLIQ
jgi:hypothetical protein